MGMPDNIDIDKLMEEGIKDFEEEGSAVADEVRESLEFLKEILKKNNNKLPPPTDIEFYSMVEYLANNFGMKYKDIAEKLGVNYNSLRTLLARARKEMERMQPLEGETGERDVLGPKLLRVVTDKVKTYFTRRVDTVTADLIGLLMDVALEFFDKHFSWCKENGKDAVACLNEGMLFYRKYRDEVEELEQKLSDYRKLIAALLAEDSELLARLAVVESFKKILKDEVVSGKLPPSQIPEILRSVEEYVRRYVVGG